MAHVASPSVVRQLDSLFNGGSVAGLSDRQLLERFNAHRDAAGEAAFAALVSRHGPMVLNICRQHLGDHHHAEDAFQAVFLVLARKARSIRDPDLLGNWLYGVAARTARCARLQLLRRRKNEERDSMRRPTSGSDSCPLMESMVQPAEQAVLDREQAEALHAEVERLPRSFRLPVVLCYFEGLTVEEAAQRLRSPHGTIRSRLARAKDKLRRGLTRRGVVMPAAAMTAILSTRPSSAAISSLLCHMTTQAAIDYATGQAARGAASTSAAALAQEVLQTMLLTKLRLTVFTMLLLATIATGAGLWGQSPAMKKNRPQQPPPAGPKPQLAVKPAVATPGRMTVTGRVLDPDGKPVKGAFVDLVGRPRTTWVGASTDEDKFTVLGCGETDAAGRFSLETPRTSSTGFDSVIALGAAPGFGLGWTALNPDAEQPAADLRLRAEQPIRARLVDVMGMPAAGIEVQVLMLGRETGKGDWDGVSLWENPPRGLRTWPGPVKTDGQGRLTLTGISRDLSVTLSTRDLRFARQELWVKPESKTAPKESTFALEPARIIEGRVLAADTGKPIPNAVVSTTTQVHNEHANGFFTAKFRADDQGRFKVNPIAGGAITLGAFPTGDEPYLIQQDELKWVKGTVMMNHDIKLPRGVLIRGKLTEEGTGRPLAGASIQFIPARSREDVLTGWQAIVASQADGSFHIVVLPGKGHLLIFGPTSDFVLKEIGSNRFYFGKPGGQRYQAHDIIAYEAKTGDSLLEFSSSLRRGVTIEGRVEGPDGQTVTNALILTTLHIHPTNPSWRGDYQLPVRDGRFDLHGLAPEASTRIYVLDPDHQWGASVELFGKQAGKDVTIKLQPCGQAKARFVGPGGKPLAKHRPHFEFVITPGPTEFSANKRDQAELRADAEYMANVDRKHYWNGPSTDADGRITLPDLIPGALYRIIDFSTVNDRDKGAQGRRDFTVKPGEILDLGEILIEKPGQP
jgi:RNA polymerase sigma factor (sigma-70 family)